MLYLIIERRISMDKIAYGETKKIIVDRKIGARRILINDRKTK
jgi:hypothetical protein